MILARDARSEATSHIDRIVHDGLDPRGACQAMVVLREMEPSPSIQIALVHDGIDAGIERLEYSHV